MKLAIVTHKLIKQDGQGRVNYEVVIEALRRGDTVTVLASEIDPELSQNTQIKYISIPVKGWPTEFIRNLVFSQATGQWLAKHQKEFDLVQVNGSITYAPGDINAVHFVHSSWLRSPYHISRSRRDLYGFYQWFYTASHAYWEKKAFRQAKINIAVSETVAKDLEEIGIATNTIKVIPNGVDIEEFAPGKAERQKWGLPQEVPLALFAGDIRISRKNLDTVLSALVKVPNLHLAVAGITEGSPYLRLAESYRLKERVYFLGLRSDVPELMKAVDFLVFPSRYDPFGLVILEAMASALPVITAQTTGAATLVTPESGIVLANPDDIEALVQAMQRLADNPKLRQDMGLLARAIAEENSWAKMAQNYLQVFDELMKS